MIASRKKTAGLLGRRFPRFRADVRGHLAADGGAPSDRGASIPRRSRRLGGPPEDRALYACGCGLAFHALVSTSVDCPGCGNTQAW